MNENENGKNEDEFEKSTHVKRVRERGEERKNLGILPLTRMGVEQQKEKK